MNYDDFLAKKQYKIKNTGIKVAQGDLNPILFDWQKDIIQWACLKGRCAVFLDTGLGKTFIQLEWARLISKRALIIAPLSVARQTQREAAKLGMDIKYVRSQSEVDSQISITNYEMLEQFDYTYFDAIVLDESSILKSIGGATKHKLISLCSQIPYKLCCTATPAPNDYIELGNHTEFLGICKSSEMLAMFFINANKEHIINVENKLYRKKGTNRDGQEWRLKHHAEQHFFEWLASWAMTMRKPSDLGYDDDGFLLPPLIINPIVIESEYIPENQLFFTHLHGVADRLKVRQATRDIKLSKLTDVINTDNGQWIIWCGLDVEASAVSESLNGVSCEVRGSHPMDYKISTLQQFQDGHIKVLITKPKIAGFGMNFQNACNMVFFGLNDSWETYYQCIRREWRYGQTRPVNVYILLSDVEQGIYSNIQRKDILANRLMTKLMQQIKYYAKKELGYEMEIQSESMESIQKGNDWTAILGDACEKLQDIESDSIDLSVYSPPFADLFTYTDSTRDLGNSKDWPEFFKHYSFIIREMLRVTKPGRLTCVHTSDIPAMANRDGYIGTRDFPGEVIRAYEKEGWIFYGRAFVQKTPQAQAIRVKSKALLFVQLRRDSSDSRPALVDQILLFKKGGENGVPINPVANGEIDNETWIEWAHGIWLGIHETDTLQYSKARGADDEKHICPLQLGTIERCIKLYSNPGETILTPFGGIGSEAYMALKLGRKAVLIELKQEYYNMAVKNLKQVENAKAMQMLI